MYVFDIVNVCKALMAAGGAQQQRTFNMGGPERLSRADMGRIVARVRGHPAENVREVPSASVKRPVVRSRLPSLGAPPADGVVRPRGGCFHRSSEWYMRAPLPPRAGESSGH